MTPHFWCRMTCPGLGWGVWRQGQDRPPNCPRQAGLSVWQIREAWSPGSQPVHVWARTHAVTHTREPPRHSHYRHSAVCTHAHSQGTKLAFRRRSCQTEEGEERRWSQEAPGHRTLEDRGTEVKETSWPRLVENRTVRQVCSCRGRSPRLGQEGPNRSTQEHLLMVTARGQCPALDSGVPDMGGPGLRESVS